MSATDRPPALKALIRARGQATITCFAILAALLMSNLLILSTLSDFGSRPVISGTPITVAVIASAATIIIGALITITYIAWANVKLDRLTKAAISELNSESKTQ